MQPMLLSAIQMVSSPNVADNLARAARLIATASAKGAKVVLLPEFFAVIAAAPDRLAVSEKFLAHPNEETPIQAWLSAQAKQHGIWLIGGSVPIQSAVAGKIYNAQLVYNPQGELISRYDKIHLFRFQRGAEAYDEHQFIVEGALEQPLIFTAEGISFAHSICYDLRFSAHYRQCAHMGGNFEVLLMPAAFTHTTGQDHWEILLRARAIENQCYVLASAQGGIHDNHRRTFGHSMIVDPWGKILELLPEGEGVIVAAFDPARLQEVRAQLPALQHQRW